MFEDGPLDDDRVDVLAPANNHVFRAIDDEDETVVVNASYVAAVQPALGYRRRRCLRFIPVARDDVGVP